MLLKRRSFSLAAGMAAAAGLTGAAVIAASANAEAGPVIGAAAPGFTAVDTQGVSHELSDFADKTVVLEWTNHQCPYVVKHYETGNMQALQTAAAEDDVVWLQVISSAPGKQGHVAPAEADQLNADRGAAPTATILDEAGVIGRSYDARTTPHMYVIHEGTLVYAGAIDDQPSANHATVEGATNYVTAALDAVAAGEPVEVAETRAYGCSVKYGAQSS